MKLVGHGEEVFGYLAELFVRHHGNFAERLDHFVLVGTDFPRIAAHVLFALAFVAHLADEPVCNVAVSDGNARTRIPQAAAQARLDDRTVGIVSAEEGVGAETVDPAFFRAADDVRAQPPEIARFRDGDAVQVRNDRCDTHGGGKFILDFLQHHRIEQVVESDVFALVERQREGDKPFFQCRFELLPSGNIMVVEEDAVDDRIVGEVSCRQFDHFPAAVRAFVAEFHALRCIVRLEQL